MKRVLCYVLILALIVPVLLVPALAATVYEFGPIPYTLSQFDFIREEFDAEPKCIYEGSIPDGRYVLTMFEDGIELISNPFDIVFVYPSDGLYYSDFDVHFDFAGGSSSIPFRLICSSTPDGVLSFLCVYADGQLIYDLGGTVLLTSVDSERIFSFLSQDLMDGVLMEVVALTPVVLGIIVLALGVRKGIGFLMALIRGS